jgi:hypothetical protein
MASMAAFPQPPIDAVSRSRRRCVPDNKNKANHQHILRQDRPYFKRSVTFLPGRLVRLQTVKGTVVEGPNNPSDVAGALSLSPTQPAG